MAGGLIGQASASTFTDVAASATVTSDQMAGGLAGSTEANTLITGCIVAGAVHGNRQSGGVVGWARDAMTVSTIVTRCASTNTVAVINSGSSPTDLGGIVGRLGNHASVKKSHFGGTLTATGASFVGGVAGSLGSDTVIEDSYVSGAIAGANTVGGVTSVTGDPTNVIRRTYVSGAVTASDGTTHGGLLSGHYDNDHTSLVSSYFNLTANPSLAAIATDGGSGGAPAVNFTGKSAVQLQDSTSFVAWDFSTVWQISSGQMPSLR